MSENVAVVTRPTSCGGGDKVLDHSAMLKFALQRKHEMQRQRQQKGNKFEYKQDGTRTDKLDEQSFYNILLVVTVILTYAVDTSRVTSFPSSRKRREPISFVYLPLASRFTFRAFNRGRVGNLPPQTPKW